MVRPVSNAADNNLSFRFPRYNSNLFYFQNSVVIAETAAGQSAIYIARRDIAPTENANPATGLQDAWTTLFNMPSNLILDSDGDVTIVSGLEIQDNAFLTITNTNGAVSQIKIDSIQQLRVNFDSDLRTLSFREINPSLLIDSEIFSLALPPVFESLIDSDFIDRQFAPVISRIAYLEDTHVDSDLLIRRLAELDSDEITNLISERMTNLADSEFVASYVNSIASRFADSEWILARIAEQTHLDSDWVLNQIPVNQVDSDWVIRTAQEYGKVDSDFVNSQISAQSYLDSDDVKAIVDSDYIVSSARKVVDMTTVDSDDVAASVRITIDSDYIQAVIDKNSFGAGDGTVDSDFVNNQIKLASDSDLALIRTEISSLDLSGNVDSDWVTARINAISTFDSETALSLIDSDYIQAVIDKNTFGTGSVDSDYVLSVANPQVDSDWVLNQIPVNQVDSDWVLSVANPQVDSEWVLARIGELDSDEIHNLITQRLENLSDSDYIRLAIKEASDSDLALLRGEIDGLDSDLRVVISNQSQLDSDDVVNLLSASSYPNSVAIGSSASGGTNTVAIGINAQATDAIFNEGSIAIGRNSTAYLQSIAIGTSGTQALQFSVAVGANVNANSVTSIAIGSNARVDSDASAGIAIGANTVASGVDSVALGHSAVAGDSEIRLGNGQVVTVVDSDASYVTLPNQLATKAYVDSVGAGMFDSDSIRTSVSIWLDSDYIVSSANKGSNFSSMFDSDSTLQSIQKVIDSDYIQAVIDKNTFGTGSVDSDYVLSQVSSVDSDWVLSVANPQVDSDWVLARLAELDSDEINSLITLRLNNLSDSEYIRLTIKQASDSDLALLRGEISQLSFVDSDFVRNRFDLDSDIVRLGKSAFVRTGALDGFNVAIGSNSIANAASAIAIGDRANADNANGVAIGNRSSSDGTGSLAIGDAAIANGLRTISIGHDANSTSESSITIGDSARSSRDFSIAFGFYANTSQPNTIAIGTYANARSGSNSIAIGTNSYAAGTSAISIGANTQSNFIASVAIGENARATGSYNIMLGDRNAKVTIWDSETASITDPNQLTNKAYVDSVVGALDSDYVTGLIDSDYIQAVIDKNTFGTGTVDSDWVLSVSNPYVDSDWVGREISSRLTSSGMLDSDTIINLIDSEYIQERQTGGGGGSASIPGHSGIASNGNTTTLTDGQAFFKNDAAAITWRVVDSDNTDIASWDSETLRQEDAGITTNPRNLLEVGFWLTGTAGVQFDDDEGRQWGGTGTTDIVVAVESSDAPLYGGVNNRLTYAQLYRLITQDTGAAPGTAIVDSDGINTVQGHEVRLRFGTDTGDDGWRVLAIGTRDLVDYEHGLLILENRGSALNGATNDNFTAYNSESSGSSFDQTLSGTGVFQYNANVGDNGNFVLGNPTIT